jgi:hypothetical protein
VSTLASLERRLGLLEARRDAARAAGASRPPLWEPFADTPQEAAYHHPADVLGYGGAAGGGKTDLLLGLAVTRHKRSIIFRREAKQLRAVVDRAREVLGGLGRLNEVAGVWRGLPGGRQVEFGGVKDPGDEQAYRGRPHDFIGFDEADQFRETQVRFLQGWLRTTDPHQRCQVVLCFNPPSSVEGRWLLTYFGAWLDPKHPRPAAPGELRWYATLPDGAEVERPDGAPFEHADEVITPRSRSFIPAKVTDNPALVRTNYVGTLQALPEPLRSQLLLGDFQAGLQDDAWQVIPTAWVKAAQARWTPEPPAGQKLSALGVDVAYGGSDRTVIAPRRGAWFGRLKKYRGAVTDSGRKAAFLVLQEHEGEAPAYVDAVGFGAACAEALEEKLGGLAVAVNVAEASGETDRSGRYRLTNLRALLYWRLREALDPVTGDNLALPPDPELLADLTAPRFEVRSSGIVVEPKEKLKERLGRSPDCGDAVALTMHPPRPCYFRPEDALTDARPLFAKGD